MSFIGNRYGRLVVIDEDNGNTNGNAVCRCDCGNTVTVRKCNLIYPNSSTRSCGCLGKESRARLAEVRFAEHRKNMRKYKTNVGYLMRTTVNKNNTTGHTGVCFNRARQQFIASITFQGKTHYLGCFSKMSEAVKARERAEEELYTPVIERFTANVVTA